MGSSTCFCGLISLPTCVYGFTFSDFELLGLLYGGLSIIGFVCLRLGLEVFKFLLSRWFIVCCFEVCGFGVYVCVVWVVVIEFGMVVYALLVMIVVDDWISKMLYL